MTSTKPNQFAKFVSTSPLSTIPHDPFLTLTSNCIRDLFGPTVQLVADGLLTRGESTLAQLTTYIEDQCSQSSQKPSHERMEMIRLANNTRVILPNRENDDCPSRSSIRASLMVLIQHFIVNVKHVVTIISTTSNTVSASNSKKRRKRSPGHKVVCRYQMDLDRGRFLMRYPRYVEYVKKTIGITAAILLEEILIHGRLPTISAVVRTVAQIEKDQKQQEADEDNADKATSASFSSATTNLSEKQGIRKNALESLVQLIQGGYLQQVPYLRNRTTTGEETHRDFDDEGEFVFGEDNDKNPDSDLPVKKKQKRSVKTEENTPADSEGGDDPAVVALLQSNTFFQTIPPKAVWGVNIAIFHEHLRALQLGWLVYERYGSRIDKSGSIVTAGLKVVATRRHAPQPLCEPNDMDDMSRFSVQELLKQLPLQLQMFFEKKPGGAIQHLYNTLMDLCRVNTPKVVMEWDVAPGKVAEARFQINTRRLVEYFRDRIVHQVIFSRSGKFYTDTMMMFFS
jgi:hypothetical protein